MAMRYGFLILRPIIFEGEPDIQIEVPTPEQVYGLPLSGKP